MADGDPYICMLAGHVSASQNASTPFAKAPLLPFWIPFWSFHSLPAIFKLPDSRILNQQRVFLRDDALESNFESIVILDRYVLNCSNINDLKAIIKKRKNNSRRERIGGRSSRKKRGDDL